MTRRVLFVGGVAAGVALLASAGVATLSTLGNEEARISTSELRRLPPIALVWADRDRAQGNASGDLYVVRADEAEPRRVLAWPARFVNGKPYGAYEARWAPDRRRIALELSVWTDDPSWQVAVVRADGRHLRKLVWPTWVSGDTAWSPMTGELAHSHHGDLWAYVPVTGRSTRIWRAGRRSGDAEIGVIEVSPDGRRLLVAGAPFYGVLPGMVSMSFDGADVVRLTYGDDTEPRWSPDGQRIAFVRGGNIHVVGADGRGLRRLTDVRGLRRGNRDIAAAAPAWSPDGRSLLFTRTRETYPDYLSDVYVVMADGGDRARRLTRGGSSSASGWSPDGRKILFVRETWDEDRPQRTWSELWIMDADGGRETRLPFNRPHWSVISVDW